MARLVSQLHQNSIIEILFLEASQISWQDYVHFDSEVEEDRFEN